MQLTVFPLPARFGTRAEFQESRQWINRFAGEFAEFYDDWLPSWASPHEVLQRVKVPQVDYFGFGEKLAVVEQGVADPEGPGFVYNQVASLLKDDFKAAHEVLGLRERVSEKEHAPRVGRPSNDYEYDIFISYPRGREWEGWVDNFRAMLAAWLAEELGRDPVFFFERQELVLGSEWPVALADALCRSRLLLAVLTPTYFRSSWAMAEWSSFEARERMTGIQPLILPVAAYGVEHYPETAAHRQFLDVRQFAFKSQGFWTSNRAAQFEAALRDFAVEIGRALKHVPPFSSDFPIVVTADYKAPTRN